MNPNDISEQLHAIEADLAKPEIMNDAGALAKLSKKYKDLKQLHMKIEERDKLSRDIGALKNDLGREPDDSLRQLITEELTDLERRLGIITEQIGEILNPADPNDLRNVIMEIRAGTGGDESTLFAAELFRMYNRFAEKKGWKCNLISSNRTGLGGFKEVIFSIEGDHIYKNLKYEMGVHRVQRIPETEKSGRVHTSAATVAVLPEAEEVDIDINPKDLRIDTFMSGGHGGQSVNTTYSAIRITHLPTNMVITCQDERSQQQNKAKAMTILRSRLLAMEEEKRAAERAHNRKQQIGTGDRSEKIRTYNFPQDRLTDHRIKQNFHNLAAIMDGDLDPIVAALTAEAKKLGTTST